MFLLQAAQRLSEALAQATTIEEGEKVVTQSIFVEFTFDTQVKDLAELPNVKSFTRSKSSKPNFTPRKASESRQI